MCVCWVSRWRGHNVTEISGKKKILSFTGTKLMVLAFPSREDGSLELLIQPNIICLLKK